ncbi:MAG: ABC transporter [Tepidiforma sp.]|nr:MAG: ABC transporter [Tepidiforma sp.]
MLDAYLALKAGAFDLDIEVRAGPGITVLFGPSGSGKSMTLRAIAGIERPARGRVVIGDVVVFDASAGIDLPPHRRRLGYAGQRPALLPHLSAAKNITFGLTRVPAAERLGVAARWLERFDLAGFEQRRPASLSGGQAQRVALARALAPGHRVLLLDEPFAALDETLRQSLRELLARLVREEGLAILFVTHDLREAHLLAHELVVLDRGRVLQAGPRDEVFRKPASRRVAELLGGVNLLRGVVVERDAGRLKVDIEGWRACCDSWAGDPAPGEPVDLVIRPERVVLRRGEPQELNVLPAVVVREFDYGTSRTLFFAPEGPGPALSVEVASRPYEVLGIATRKRWLLELPPGDLHAMPPAEGPRQ